MRAYTELYAGGGTLIVTATTEATAQIVVEGPNMQIGNSTYEVEFSCASAVAPPPPDRLVFVLFENETPVGQLAYLSSSAGTARPEAPISGRRIRQPAGGSVVFSVRAYATAGTGTIYAGNGAAGNPSPALMTVKIWGSR